MLRAKNTIENNIKTKNSSAQFKELKENEKCAGIIQHDNNNVLFDFSTWNRTGSGNGSRVVIRVEVGVVVVVVVELESGSVSTDVRNGQWIFIRHVK